MDATEVGVQLVVFEVTVEVTASAGDPSNVPAEGVEADTVADPEQVPEMVKLLIFPAATRDL